MTIKELMRESHATAKEKGWWDKPRTPLEMLMLVVMELAEAGEDIRQHRGTHLILMQGNKPCGFPIELADVMLWVSGMAEEYEIDLERAIQMKSDYNKTRPYRHGGKAA